MQYSDGRRGVPLMSNELIIGTVGYPIRKQRVLAEVDMVEMTEARQIPPGKGTGRRLRSEMPGHSACSIQISSYFVDDPPAGASLKGAIKAYGDFQVTDESMGLWKRQTDFAKELRAKILVLITPPSIRPSDANIQKMTAFFSSIDRQGLDIAWEPHGPWEFEYAADFALQNNLVLAVDPLRDAAPLGPLAYFRLGPFSSMGSRVGVYDLEQIAEAASSFETAYCVFDTPKSLDDAKNLKKIVDGEEFDYEF